MTSSDAPLVPVEQVGQFDYRHYSPEIVSFLKKKKGEILLCYNLSLDNLITMGRHIAEVKERIGWGGFLEWAKAELPFSTDTAARWMGLAQVEDQYGILDTKELPITTSALYSLATHTTPPAAREEAIERAKRGEKIDQRKAAEIKRRHKQFSPAKTTRAEIIGTIATRYWIALEGTPHRIYQGLAGDPRLLEQLPETIDLFVDLSRLEKNSISSKERRQIESLGKRCAYQIAIGCAASASADDGWITSVRESLSVLFRACAPDGVVLIYAPRLVPLLDLADEYGITLIGVEPDERACEKLVNAHQRNNDNGT
jgi:hypothetical protein